MRWSLALVLTFCLACSGVEPSLGHSRHRESPASGPYSVVVVDSGGRQLETFRHRGRTYVLGTRGQRYQIRVRNRSGHRVEAVVSVDGRDVLDGKSASWRKRGYIIGPWEDLTLEGFRISSQEVAAFRFSSVANSYAAQMGNAREVGVIGVALFPEYRARRRRPVRRRRYRYPPPTRRPDGTIGGLRDQNAGKTAAEAGPRRPSGGDNDALAGGKRRHAPPQSGSGGALGSNLQSRRHRRRTAEDRSGLGTAFGERRDSQVVDVRFRRRSNHPAHQLIVRYDNRPGLLSLGIDVDRWSHRVSDQELRESARPFRESSRGYATPPRGWR